MKKKKGRKGLAIIENLVVIMIIAILVVAFWPSIIQARLMTNVSACKTNLEKLREDPEAQVRCPKDGIYTIEGEPPSCSVGGEGKTGHSL